MIKAFFKARQHSTTIKVPSMGIDNMEAEQRVLFNLGYSWAGTNDQEVCLFTNQNSEFIGYIINDQSMTISGCNNEYIWESLK